MDIDPRRFKPVILGAFTPIAIAGAAILYSHTATPTAPVQVIESSSMTDLIAADDSSDGDAAISSFSVEQRAASTRRTQAIRRAGFEGVKNPFFYQPRHETDPVVEASRDDDIGLEADVEIPRMQLTGIMGGRRVIAIINGDLFQVGQTIEPGWKVLTIDPVGHTVVVEGPNGVQVTLRSEN
jgi:hypothetical protein